MKKYIKSNNFTDNFIDFQYSVAYNTEKDKEYFKNKYTKAGKHGVRVKRVKTDTPGLPMYQITWESEDSSGTPYFI